MNCLAHLQHSVSNVCISLPDNLCCASEQKAHVWNSSVTGGNLHDFIDEARFGQDILEEFSQVSSFLCRYDSYCIAFDL